MRLRTRCFTYVCLNYSFLPIHVMLYYERKPFKSLFFPAKISLSRSPFIVMPTRFLFIRVVFADADAAVLTYVLNGIYISYSTLVNNRQMGIRAPWLSLVLVFFSFSTVVFFCSRIVARPTLMLFYYDANTYIIRFCICMSCSCLHFHSFES